MHNMRNPNPNQTERHIETVSTRTHTGNHNNQCAPTYLTNTHTHTVVFRVTLIIRTPLQKILTLVQHVKFVFN